MFYVNSACYAFMSSADFFQNKLFKNYFRTTIRVSNSLNPDQDRHSVGPDLDPNCLKRLSADDKTPASKESVKVL